ncbi:T9SS-dependent M36 family metallopeptidase [Flavobacterium sp. 25HG05S-40]|uniref:T9SS-dependent M36 family metallopeptidase n=1 Tax=Flavobacterium sp. 25HG05S-40 TaxID=3458682 RepID=UPI004044903E
MIKKILTHLLVLLPFMVFSQNEEQQIKNYLQENHNRLGLTLNDVSDWIVESKASSKSTKINNFYIKQRYQGKEIFHTVTNVWIKNGAVLEVKSKFVPNLQNKINTSVPVLNVTQSIQVAKQELGYNAVISHDIIESKDNTKFQLSNGLLRPIKATLAYVLDDTNALRLSWSFLIQTPKKEIWLVFIDAVNGRVLKKVDKILSCNFNSDSHHHKSNFFFKRHFFKPEMESLFSAVPSSYRVFPYNIESPNHGNRQLIVNPSNALASPFGWHDTDGIFGAEFTATQGNNVFAYEDTFDQDFGESVQTDPSLSFDFPFPGNTAEPSAYLNAAITNLFYMNNIVHDVFYQYGFDEENGNFQNNNYGNEGFDQDQLFAEAQDGGGINNANMYTPLDGENPTMQMYLWNRKPEENLITINAPSAVSGTYPGIRSNFRFFNVELPVSPDAIVSELVLYDDGFDDSADACDVALNASELLGKIAVVRRGGCTNDDKLVNIQESGAVAVIIINTIPNKFYVSGFGFDATIPVIGVTQEVGNILLQAIENGPVNVSLSRPDSGFLFNDSDFDNLVITHEYGHGITNRLVGGSLNVDCLDNREQMGEGWSDWFGLMMQMKPGDSGADKRGIGTYVSNQPTDDVGIRNFPYSTDMTINPVTFRMTNTFVVPHGVGSVWASMLWDLTWAYVGKYGFNPNIYSGNGGNNKVLQIVIDALKLQPCSPSFVDGRDAILAADQAITGGEDYCMIWEVFARRGLGLSANSGDTFSAIDQTESFDVPAPGPNCSLGIDYVQNQDLIAVSPNPSTGIFSIKIHAFTGIINYQVYDINGRKITEKRNVNFANETQVNLGSLQAGAYFIKIDAETFSVTKKIIIK